MNKPVVLANGTWAFPISVWNQPGGKRGKDGAKIYLSCDHGKTFGEQGRAKVPRRVASFDEHSIVKFADGSLKMIIQRNLFGNLECISKDGGKTWSKPVTSPINGPCSHLWGSRLKSGLVNNDCGTKRRRGMKRAKMTA